MNIIFDASHVFEIFSIFFNMYMRKGRGSSPFCFGWRLNQPMNIETYCLYIYIHTCLFILYSYYIVIYVVCLSTWTTSEQSFFLQVKIYMKVDLHMVGCRQFAGVRRLA